MYTFRIYFFIILVLAFSIVSEISWSMREVNTDDIVYVPDDYPTVSEALENVPDDSVIYVRSGSYLDSVFVHGRRNISIIGLGNVSIIGILWIEDSENITVWNINFTYSSIITIRNSSNILLETYVHNLDFPGLDIEGSENVMVYGIIHTDSFIGIQVESSRNIVFNNTIIYSKIYGIMVFSSQIILDSVKLLGGGITLIPDNGLSSIDAVNTTLNDKPVLSPKNMDLGGGSIRNMYPGIDPGEIILQNISNAVVDNYTFNGSTPSIILYNCNGITIDSLSIRDSGEAITILYSRDIKIENTIVEIGEDLFYGISIYNSQNINIVNTTVSSNIQYSMVKGFTIDNSRNITIYKSSIINVSAVLLASFSDNIKMYSLTISQVEYSIGFEDSKIFLYYSSNIVIEDTYINVIVENDPDREAENISLIYMESSENISIKDSNITIRNRSGGTASLITFLTGWLQQVVIGIEDSHILITGSGNESSILRIKGFAGFPEDVYLDIRSSYVRAANLVYLDTTSRCNVYLSIYSSQIISETFIDSPIYSSAIVYVDISYSTLIVDHGVNGNIHVEGKAYLNMISGYLGDGIIYYNGPFNYTFRGRNYTSYLGNYWMGQPCYDADGDGIGDEPLPYDPYPICPMDVKDIVFNGSGIIVVETIDGENYRIRVSSNTSVELYGVAEILGKRFPAYSILYTTRLGNATIISTSRIDEIVSGGNRSVVWVNITLSKRGLIWMYIPGNYSVNAVFKNGSSLSYRYDRDSRTLFIGDPVNISILLVSNTEAGNETSRWLSGETIIVKPVPEPYILLPILLVSTLILLSRLPRRKTRVFSISFPYPVLPVARLDLFSRILSSSLPLHRILVARSH